MVVESAEPLGDRFAGIPAAVFFGRVGLLVAADGAPARGVEPAIVEQDVRREFIREYDFRLIVFASLRVAEELLDRVRFELLHRVYDAGRAVAVADRFVKDRRFPPGVGPPFDHEKRAIGAEGHADGVHDDRGLGHDFDAETQGGEETPQLGIEVALIDEFGLERGGLRRCLLLDKLRWGRGALRRRSGECV